MGCTSSAPNMPEIAANTTETPEDDNSNVTYMKVGEDVIIDNDLKDTTVSKVLPICDSLEENIQLARNSNSFTKTDNEEREQENQMTNDVEIQEKKSEDESEDNKLLSTLKEVADQVILNTIHDDIDQTSTLHQETPNDKEENIITDTEENKAELVEQYSDEQTEAKEEQENVEESSSPSQSDGNRSTRWEALADIAAELPPSLAVDPITGQIYSLAK
ncbi:uncharacterized protein LOC120630484 [Pararge aegeria]|nr:uncharacterized protein LOC120630484 [Pararge aegeria]